MNSKKTIEPGLVQRQRKKCTCHNFPVIKGEIDKLFKCGVTGILVDRTGRPIPQTRIVFHF